MCNLTLRSVLHEKQLGASEHARNAPISLAFVIIQAAGRPTGKSLCFIESLRFWWVTMLSVGFELALGCPLSP